jgi:hypothetical protein
MGSNGRAGLGHDGVMKRSSRPIIRILTAATFALLAHLEPSLGQSSPPDRSAGGAAQPDPTLERFCTALEVMPKSRVSQFRDLETGGRGCGTGEQATSLSFPGSLPCVNIHDSSGARLSCGYRQVNRPHPTVPG